MSAVTKLSRLFFGVLPGVDTAMGLIVRYVYLGKLPRPSEIANPYENSRSELFLYKITNGSRNFKRLFEFTAIAFCAAAVLGATLFPIPGLGPITAVGSIGVLKMLGISWGYTIAARTLGAFIGSVIDRYTYSAQIKSAFGWELGKNKKRDISTTLFTALTMGLFGELGLLTASRPYSWIAKKWSSAKQEQQDSAVVSISGSSYYIDNQLSDEHGDVEKRKDNNTQSHVSQKSTALDSNNSPARGGVAKGCVARFFGFFLRYTAKNAEVRPDQGKCASTSTSPSRSWE